MSSSSRCKPQKGSEDFPAKSELLPGSVLNKVERENLDFFGEGKVCFK